MTTPDRLRVLALAAYPIEAAATRYRLAQHQDGLRDRGIDLHIRPFMSGKTFSGLYTVGRRARARTAGGILAASGRTALFSMRHPHFDAVIVQREAAIIGPPISESRLVNLGIPLILDIDDAIYLKPAITDARPWSHLRAWPNKFDRLIELADIVTCGSENIRTHIGAQGKDARLVPNVLDPARWTPKVQPDAPLTVGWIGTHSTFSYLRRIFPALESAAEVQPFRLLVIGSGQQRLRLAGIEVIQRDWSLEREVSDFQEINIGLYPIDNDEWGRGKSALKSVQYMMTGIPHIASPVGEVANLGHPGHTHLTAETLEEWSATLTRLLGSGPERRSIGQHGREYAVAHRSLSVAQEALTSILTGLARRHPKLGHV